MSELLDPHVSDEDRYRWGCPTEADAYALTWLFGAIKQPGGANHLEDEQ